MQKEKGKSIRFFFKYKLFFCTSRGNIPRIFSNFSFAPHCELCIDVYLRSVKYVIGCISENEEQD